MGPIIVKLLPALIPVASMILTPLWTSIQEWIANHPIETALAAGSTALANWFLPSPMKRDRSDSRANNARSSLRK